MYLFKVNNENTRTLYKIYSKFTIKTTERRPWTYSSGVSIVDFEQVNGGGHMIDLLMLSNYRDYHSLLKMSEIVIL